MRDLTIKDKRLVEWCTQDDTYDMTIVQGVINDLLDLFGVIERVQADNVLRLTIIRRQDSGYSVVVDLFEKTIPDQSPGVEPPPKPKPEPVQESSGPIIKRNVY